MRDWLENSQKEDGDDALEAAVDVLDTALRL